jgi:hypothetical protein
VEISVGKRRPWREAKRSLPNIAEVNDQWSCCSTTPYAFMPCSETALALNFTEEKCICQVFILSNGCTIKYSKKILKFTLKLTLKMLLHVSV